MYAVIGTWFLQKKKKYTILVLQLVFACVLQ